MNGTENEAEIIITGEINRIGELIELEVRLIDRGTGKTVGENKFIVRPNESTYIKMGEIHRLENEGKIPVVLIEAQVGEYTGEDDIVRIEDDFQREL